MNKRRMDGRIYQNYSLSPVSVSNPLNNQE